MTTMGDLVLIYFEDKPMSFARVEDILPDSKPGWFHIKLLMLQVPLQVVSWILRDVYIEGDEFTMNGNRMRLERVISPEALDLPVETPSDAGGGVGEKAPSAAAPTAGKVASGKTGSNQAASKKAKVISLTDRKRS